MKKAGRTATAKKVTKKTAAKGAAPAADAVSLPEPDLESAFRLVMQMMAIPGTSCEEDQIVAFIRQQLLDAGIPESAITNDTAHQRSPRGGAVGNLICKLPGTAPGKRRLLMAHVDTVPLCVGCQPVREGDFVRSAKPDTGLGADDRAGAAVVLNTALELVRQNIPHPPLTFFWPVQEEIGLHGARHASLSQLGSPKLAFNWDGGSPEKVTIGATGAYRLEIQVNGLASHAGGAPERGISAIAIASLAIAQLHADGWHGDIHKGKQHGTSNIGVINGGAATNVVTDLVKLRAEARSHNPAFRKKIVDAIDKAFATAVKQVKNVEGARGSYTLESQMDYEAFKLDPKEPCVQLAQQAIKSTGGEPLLFVANGGLDANWMTARGIPTVTMGCGQVNVHTVNERLDINAFRHACRIGLRLASATE